MHASEARGRSGPRRYVNTNRVMFKVQRVKSWITNITRDSARDVPVTAFYTSLAF